MVALLHDYEVLKHSLLAQLIQEEFPIHVSLLQRFSWSILTSFCAWHLLKETVFPVSEGLALYLLEFTHLHFYPLTVVAMAYLLVNPLTSAS